MGKGVIISIVIVLILIIGVIFFYFIGDQPSPTNLTFEEAKTKCDSLSETERERENCYLEAIQAENIQISFEECGEIMKSESTKIYCETYSAINSQDPEKCEQINAVSASFKDICYRGIGKNTGDPHACDSLSSEPLGSGPLNKEARKELCYADVAEHLRDPEICELIESTLRKDSCYLLVAIKAQKTNICNEIEDGSTKATCTDKTSKLVAGPSYCQGIEDDSNQIICYSNLERDKRQEIVNRLNVEVDDCKTLKYKESQEICIAYIAQKTEDPTLASQITTESILTRLLINLAIIKEDPTLCENIKDQDRKQHCASCATKEKLCGLIGFI